MGIIRKLANTVLKKEFNNSDSTLGYIISGLLVKLAGTPVSNATTKINFTGGINAVINGLDSSQIDVSAVGGGGGANQIDDLTDVLITSPSINQILQYNGSGQWINVANSVGATNLDGLSDVIITSPADDQFLRHNGSFWVNETVTLGVTTLNGLTDVTLTSPANNEVLTYDSGTSQWINAVAVSGATNLDGLSDVIITSPVITQFLRHNGTNWVNESVTLGSTNLDGLSDVIITSPVITQFLRHNGTNWVNETVTLGATNLDGLSDVIITSPVITQFLRHNGTDWVNETVTLGATTLDGLTDVATTGQGTGDILVKSAGDWVPSSQTAGADVNIGLTRLNDTLIATPTTGDILTYTGGGWANTSNVQAVAPATIAWDGLVPANAFLGSCVYTDNFNYTVGNGSASACVLYYGLFDGSVNSLPAVKYLNGTAQTILNTAFWGLANQSTCMIQNGYIYIYIVETGVQARIYRCLLTADISVFGNWTLLTISGTALGLSFNDHLAGYGDGKFWITNGTGLVPYTLASTTLTSSATVTVTGTTGNGSRVNDTGIYASFAADPSIRFADFTGTLDGTKQIKATSASRFALPRGFYISQRTNGGDIGNLVKTPF